MLTGILLEVDRPIAFIENQSTGSTQRLTLGDSVARGEISQIGLDFLEYETSDGQVTRVEIGRTFTGEAPAVQIPAAPPATTSAPSAPAAPGNDEGENSPPRPAVLPTPPAAVPGAADPAKGNLSIEEKMKLKRQQELKK